MSPVASSSALSSVDGERFPYATMIVLMLLNFSESMQGNIIWPFISEAVQRWGVSSHETAFYVGILASSFFLAQFLFVVFWGKAADRYGRRPALLWGLVGTGATMLLFGFVRSYWLAVLNRFLTGALNGNVAISKVVAGEIAPRSQLTRAFMMLSFVWGMGTILAPALGGFLASPAEQYPGSSLDIPLLRDYPYLLPALISSVWAWMALILGMFCLPETEVFLQKKRLRDQQKRRARGSENVSAELEMTHTPGKAVERQAGPKDERDEGSEEGDGQMLLAVAPDVSSRESDKLQDESVDLQPSTSKGQEGTEEHEEPEEAASNRLAAAAAGSANKDIDKTEVVDTPGTTKKTKRPAEKFRRKVRILTPEEEELEKGQRQAAASADTPGRPRTREAGHFSARVDAESDDAALLVSSSGGAAQDEDDPAATSITRGWKDKAIRHSLLAYALLSTAMIIFEELVPVFCRMPLEDGGLAFPTNQVGEVQIISGIAHLATQLLVFPRINGRFGPLKSFRGAMLPLIALSLFPAIGRLAAMKGNAESGPLVWTALGFALVLKTSCSSIAFTTIIIIINNSARGVAVGTITGLSQAVASFVRTVGPTLGGGLFSLTLEWGGGGLGVAKLHTVYVVIALFAVLGFASSYGIPAWCDHGPDYSKLQVQGQAQVDSSAEARVRENDVVTNDLQVGEGGQVEEEEEEARASFEASVAAADVV